MQNCGATFNVNVNQQQVLPFADLLSQKQTQKVAILPIGAKIKSFKKREDSILIARWK